jgi:hypothetical protein
MTMDDSSSSCNTLPQLQTPSEQGGMQESEMLELTVSYGCAGVQPQALSDMIAFEEACVNKSSPGQWVSSTLLFRISDGTRLSSVAVKLPNRVIAGSMAGDIERVPCRC